MLLGSAEARRVDKVNSREKKAGSRSARMVVLKSN